VYVPSVRFRDSRQLLRQGKLKCPVSRKSLQVLHGRLAESPCKSLIFRWAGAITVPSSCARFVEGSRKIPPRRLQACQQTSYKHTCMFHVHHVLGINTCLLCRLRGPTTARIGPALPPTARLPETARGVRGARGDAALTGHASHARKPEYQNVHDHEPFRKQAMILRSIDEAKTYNECG